MPQSGVFRRNEYMKKTTLKPKQRCRETNEKSASTVNVSELCDLERKLAKAFLDDQIPPDSCIDLELLSDFDKKRLRLNRHIARWILKSQAFYREDSVAFGLLKLIDTLIEAVERLPLSERQKAARQRDSWPVLLPLQKEAQKETFKRVALLRVGSNCVLESAKKKPMSFDSAINHLARHYRDKIAAEQFVIATGPGSEKRLPQFSKKTAAAWGEAGWRLLLREIPEPEKHPILGKVGKHRESHAVRMGRQTTITKGTAKAENRAGIRTAFLQAFKTLPNV